MAVVIKGVSEETWKLFKAEAARQGLKHGELFIKMVHETISEPGAEEAWEQIFNWEPIFTKEEADWLEQEVIKWRKNATGRTFD